MEAWADYRRLGLPADMPLTFPVHADQPPARIPKRFMYVTSEYSSNAANTPLVQDPFDEYHVKKIFWGQ